MTTKELDRIYLDMLQNQAWCRNVERMNDAGMSARDAVDAADRLVRANGN